MGEQRMVAINGTFWRDRILSYLRQSVEKGSTDIGQVLPGHGSAGHSEDFPDATHLHEMRPGCQESHNRAGNKGIAGNKLGRENRAIAVSQAVVVFAVVVFAVRPNGATECSHGWSNAVVWRCATRG